MEKNSKEFFDYANKEYEKLLGIPQLGILSDEEYKILLDNTKFGTLSEEEKNKIREAKSFRYIFREAFFRELYLYADRNPKVVVEGKKVRIVLDAEERIDKDKVEITSKGLHLDNATNGIYRGYESFDSVSFSITDDKKYLIVNKSSNEVYGTKNNNGMPPMNLYSRSCDIYDSSCRVAHYYGSAEDRRDIPSEMETFNLALRGLVKKNEYKYGTFLHEESYARDAGYPGIVNSVSYHFRKKNDQSYDVKYLQSCYDVSLERPEEMNVGQPFYQIDLAGGKEIIPPTVNGKRVTLYDAKEYYNQIYKDSLQPQSQSKGR